MNTAFRTSDSDASSSPRAPRASFAKRWRHLPSGWLYELRSHEPVVLGVLLLVTFFIFIYAADLKGVWNDDAVRLTIANGGVSTAGIENRRPGHTRDVIEAIGHYAVQPAYPLLVNRILRLTHSYSVIPILTTILLTFLLSALGIYLLARPLLNPSLRLLAVLLYVWNGFAMVHVLQVREYSLILFFQVYNTLVFYRLFNPLLDRRKWTFWLLALAYCLSCSGAFYTTKWAPFFLWPQAVIALLWMRRNVLRSLTVLGSLGVAALSCLPSVLSIQKNNVVFAVWDKRPPSMGLLLSRLHIGTEHLFVGYRRAALSFLETYYWGLLVVLLTGLVIFGCRFFRERLEVQHLVLTILGFLSFQILYFFFREPLSTWPRYFILYLPYVVLLIPLSFSRILVAVAVQPVRRRAWAYSIFLLVAAVAGCAQLKYNYENPYIDHGPDFREVYRYLISRAAPADKIVVGYPTNRMALNYYWPTPSQIQLGYKVVVPQQANLYPNVWTVSYKDENSKAYRKYARDLKHLGYKLKTERVISRVTVRRFHLRPRKSDRVSGFDNNGAGLKR